MRAKPTSSSRSSKQSRSSSKSRNGHSKGVAKKNKEPEKKVAPDLSVLRQPVETSVCGLKQAVKVYETGTPEVIHLLTYDCDVVYECKICRNLFRSIANFISHKRIYCTQRYSRSQDLQRSNTQAEDYTVILGEKVVEKLPTRITARKDLTSIIESLAPSSAQSDTDRSTTVHLEPMENTSYGVFQTVLKPDSQLLMRNQVSELQNLLSKNEVVLGPDGRILQNGLSDLSREKVDPHTSQEDGLFCLDCNLKFANAKTFSRHKKLFHESLRARYSCPCCKNYFSNPWSVYRHLYKVHRKTNEQVRRLRSQIHNKGVRFEKSENNVSKKNIPSPSKKKLGNEHHQKIIQDNKEWMDHLEDDGDVQRCGGCARKFERKAALTAHSHICQKRIAACNRIEQNHLAAAVNKDSALAVVPVVTVSPLSCSKKPIPKPSPEKKIGIQVRMNYCKSGTGSPSHISSHMRSSRSILGDESDIEATSTDGKDTFFHHGDKNTSGLKGSLVLDQFFSKSNKCRSSERVEKVNSYLNNSANTIDNVHSYEISTCKRSTVLRSNLGKNKNLESKCLQLRTALENGVSENSIKNDLENSVYFDGNMDNTSESNTSGLSSLSSQITPLVDKGYVCEVEQSIEIKNINISRSLENTPKTEADSTSNGGIHMTFNTRTYKENIKFSPPNDTACEEVSTSIVSDDMSHLDSKLNVESICLNDDEISVDLKPLCVFQDESKGFIQDSELENTISVLTRNQLKAICKDDIMPSGEENCSSASKMKSSKEAIAEVNSKTKEIMKKQFNKYVDEERKKCRLCKKKFKKNEKVYNHMTTHTRWKRYKCMFNGCSFQAFFLGRCQRHTKIHTKDNNGEPIVSLVGIIDPRKWNVRLLDNARKASKEISPGIKGTNIKRTRETATKRSSGNVAKISKKNSILSKQKKLKLKSVVEFEKGKQKRDTLLAKSKTKQKLLTDFKTFSTLSKLNLKKALLAKNKNTSVRNLQNKEAVVKPLPKKSSSSFEDDGIIDANASQSSGIFLTKTQRKASISNLHQENSTVIKKEIKEDVFMNHNIDGPSETVLDKGRSSRGSSRKSSVNSVEQLKLKNNYLVKMEDDNNISKKNECVIGNHIQSSEFVDGSSSLEEEESQELDRPVDDSHLKNIVMEVIFGSSSHQPPNTGRPVRNKTRPKRDSDFILSNQQKDIDKENGDGKLLKSKKVTKNGIDVSEKRRKN